jgi:hypothetical protein
VHDDYRVEYLEREPSFRDATPCSSPIARLCGWRTRSASARQFCGGGSLQRELTWLVLE